MVCLLNTTWDDSRESFDIKELEILVRKLGRCGQGFCPIFHMMPSLHASGAFSLRENKNFLHSTHKRYRKLIKKSKCRLCFVIGQSVRKVHVCMRTYRIPISIEEEINFLRKLLQDNSVPLATPIGHIIPRDHACEQAAGACKRSGGGWNVDLTFWWHLVFPREVLERALLPNNKKGKLISINVLEMVCAIVNVAAAIFFCDNDCIALSSYLVLLNWCDNTTACTWINRNCKHSMIGQQLSCLFVGLLMGKNIGIQAEWISTNLNVIANDISRFKDKNDEDFDYENLRETYTSCIPCRQFQPSTTLLTMIWDILMNKSCPDPLTVKGLKPSALGQFIS